MPASKGAADQGRDMGSESVGNQGTGGRGTNNAAGGALVEQATDAGFFADPADGFANQRRDGEWAQLV